MTALQEPERWTYYQHANAIVSYSLALILGCTATMLLPSVEISHPQIQSSIPNKGTMSLD
jgi:hypothetical protein